MRCTVGDVGGPDFANAMTAAEVFREVVIVEADLTAGIDAAGSQVQQTAQQFQTTFEAEQSLESETDQHWREQDRQRHCRQQAGTVR